MPVFVGTRYKLIFTSKVAVFTSVLPCKRPARVCDTN